MKLQLAFASMSWSLNFLSSLKRAERSSAMLMPFVDDPDGFGAAIDEHPSVLADIIARGGQAAMATVADFHTDAFACAGALPDGTVVVADQRFADWLRNPDNLGPIIGKLATCPQVTTITYDNCGRPVAVAAATALKGQLWPISPVVQQAIDRGLATHVVLALSPGSDCWQVAARACDLSPSELKLLQRLSVEGDLRTSCAAIGIAYETGRKLVASLLRKTGSARQADLIRFALTVAAGAITPPRFADATFADLFGLRLRQAELARAIATGSVRKAAADRVGVSGARAKADLKACFAACGVTSVVDLSRIMAEVDALTALAEACDVTFQVPGKASCDPLRLIPRATGGGRIAVSDHGPSGGRPVLIFHTTTGGRAQSPKMLAALCQSGFRAIVIERPGYGLTDFVDGDIWHAAARDVEHVLNNLKIDHAAILARGGAQPAVFTAALLGQRIAGGVLLGPDPPVELDSARSGMMGRAKGWVYDTPAMLAPLAAVLSRRTSAEQIARLMRASVRGSAIDEAICDDPAEMDALVRGGRQSAFGMYGFVAEHAALGSRRPLPEIGNGSRWSVLFGAQDPLFCAADGQHYWRSQIKGCMFEEVAGAGRFLHASHAPDVCAALERSFAVG